MCPPRCWLSNYISHAKTLMLLRSIPQPVVSLLEACTFSLRPSYVRVAHEQGKHFFFFTRFPVFDLQSFALVLVSLGDRFVPIILNAITSYVQRWKAEGKSRIQMAIVAISEVTEPLCIHLEFQQVPVFVNLQVFMLYHCNCSQVMLGIEKIQCENHFQTLTKNWGSVKV